MANSDTFTGAQQENVLTLLCWSDTSYMVVRGAVTANLWTNPIYRDIVQRVLDYIDQFKKPPKDHLPDLLEDVLSGKDERKAEVVGSILSGIDKLRHTINETFVRTRLDMFVRAQAIKIGIVEISDALTRGDIDEAEHVMDKVRRMRLTTFSPGMSLSDVARKMRSGEDRREVVQVGIHDYDIRELGPGRKELHLHIAPPKRGKSWWLIHLAKRAMMQRWRVVYITLELSEMEIGRRMLQSVFALGRRRARQVYSMMRKDKLGRLIELELLNETPKLNLDDDGVMNKVDKLLAGFHQRDLFRVKEFPTGQLPVAGVHAYLDTLEQQEGFVPDLVCLDYTDLLKIDMRDYRHALGQNTVDLRGLAVERNLAMATASQSNKEGTRSKIIDGTHAAEDYSKIFTADTIQSYNRTRYEKAVNMARLHVANTRVSDSDEFSLLLTQHYPTGQFALDSVFFYQNYEQMVENEAMPLLADMAGDGDEEA